MDRATIKSGSSRETVSDTLKSSSQSIEGPRYEVDVPIDKVDFHPQKIPSGNTTRYENLVELVMRANHWLQCSPHVKAFKIETVTYPITEFKHFKDANSSAKRQEFDNQYYFRYLRLWVRTPTQEEKETEEIPQRLYSVNIIPKKVRRDNSFEKMEEAMQRYFNKIQKDPIQGRIISVITDEVLVEDWPNEVEADKLYWIDSKHGETAYVTVMRLFIAYDMDVNVEPIGFEDFIPKLLGYDEAISAPILESFTTVLGRARDWINQHSNMEVVGIQTVRCRTRGLSVEERTPLDTKHTLVNGNSEVELFVQYIRVYLLTVYELPEDGVFEDDDVETVELYQRTFLPHIYRGTKKVPLNYFTDQLFTLQTMYAWLRASRSDMITVETCAVIHTSAGLLTDSEVMWYRSSRMGNVVVFITRLFTNGSFVEPLPSLLPTPPRIPPTLREEEPKSKTKNCVVQ